MQPPASKDYANRPSGEGVVFYNQHLQAEPFEGQEKSGEVVQSQAAAHTPEHAAQQRLPGAQSQQDAQDEQQVQPQPQPHPQPDLQPPASQLQQALRPPQQQRPPVPAGGQMGAAAALLPGLSRVAEEGDGEAGPSAAAGVIFGCTNSTYEECFRLSMVGLPRKYLPLVESIVAEHTLIFLFNFSDRQLHGVYIATSAGQARHAMHHSTMRMQLCGAAVQCKTATHGLCIALRGAAHPRLHTTCQRVQPFASEAANPLRLLGCYRPVHAAPCVLRPRACYGAEHPRLPPHALAGEPEPERVEGLGGRAQGGAEGRARAAERHRARGAGGRPGWLSLPCTVRRLAPRVVLVVPQPAATASRG